ncbi:hypothetical protein ACFC6L_24070 [Kitasatospora phosalacinea]|uniref:hypothetical protein n=1 Tax=Kitasatospora phosalacinea TaxID=2065 RepID=UPI0035D76C76
MHPTGPTAQRFPLVPRIRPACLPLNARVGRLTELADTAARQNDAGLASTVLNQAALLASDLDLPADARTLCHRHATLHLTRGPLTTTGAIRGLEPLVNLARLHLRAGRHQHGHQLLLHLYRAVTTATETTLDGITVPARLTATDQQRTEVRQWLWRVVLADGTRALTAAGRWQDALHHLKEHRGIGRRLLDGRQTAVLAATTTGDHPAALALLHDTEPGAPWEDAVTAALTALCRPGDQHAADHAADLWTDLEPGDGLAVFTTRLALTVLDTMPSGASVARSLVRSIISRTNETGDGYALRDLLAHPGARAALDAEQATALEQALAACALGSRSMPEKVRRQLDTAVDGAAGVLENAPFDPGTPGSDPLERRPSDARPSDPRALPSSTEHALEY